MSVVDVQQKALRAHLATLSIAISEQIDEIKKMENLYYGFEEYNFWPHIRRSNKKLTKCLLLYVGGTTPLTNLHLAVVSRLSESYRLEILAARHCYDQSTSLNLKKLANIPRMSAKFLAYAIIAIKNKDFVLYGYCVQVAEALQNSNEHFYVLENMFNESLQENARKSTAAQSNGHFQLVSVYALLSRYAKIRFAISLLIRWNGSTAQLDSEKNRCNDAAMQEYKNILSNVESFLCDNKTDAVDVVCELILSHAQYDNIEFTEADLERVLQLCRCIIGYVRGFHITIPATYASAVGLSKQLWNRALLEPDNNLFKKLTEYASNTMQVN